MRIRFKHGSTANRGESLWRERIVGTIWRSRSIRIMVIEIARMMFYDQANFWDKIGTKYLEYVDMTQSPEAVWTQSLVELLVRP